MREMCLTESKKRHQVKSRFKWLFGYPYYEYLTWDGGHLIYLQASLREGTPSDGTAWCTHFCLCFDVRDRADLSIWCIALPALMNSDRASICWMCRRTRWFLQSRFSTRYCHFLLRTTIREFSNFEHVLALSSFWDKIDKLTIKKPGLVFLFFLSAIVHWFLDLVNRITPKHLLK